VQIFVWFVGLDAAQTWQPAVRQSVDLRQKSAQAAPHFPNTHLPQFLGLTEQSELRRQDWPQVFPPEVKAQRLDELHVGQFLSKHWVEAEQGLPQPAPQIPRTH